MQESIENEIGTFYNHLMISAHPLLARRPTRPAPSLSLLPEAEDLQLVQGRVHEACGSSRRTLAMWLAAQTDAQVIWISPSWAKDQLSSDGVSAWINPSRLIFVTPRRAEDLLWTMEEVLRSGAISLCIADLPELPGLTPVRRLHLAAETGAQNGQGIPTGILLPPGKGGAPGVETRWHIAPRHARGQESWYLERLRARTAPHKSWLIGRSSVSEPPRIKTA